MRRSSAIWLVPPIALAIAVAVFLSVSKKEPDRTASETVGIPVRTTTIESADFIPVARGWGSVRAAETWTAVSEVKGQVIWRHPALETGKIIPGGTKVLEIDPADYRLAIGQAEADLAVYAAETAQIEAEAENTKRILALEKERLKLAESELARNRDLLAQGVAAQNRVDEAERAALSGRRNVVELENALALVSPRLDRLKAQAERTNAALLRNRRDLERTVIVTPYDLRVTSVPVERFQFVNVGQTLATADGIARSEVVVQLPLDAFRRVLAGTDPIEDTLAAIRSGPSGRIGAEVRLVSDPSQVWNATMSRVEGALDARARTVPVVVTIEDPYGNANPPLRPPLVPNMQVEVTLTGRTIPGAIIVPETALHEGTAYVANAENRLELRPTTEAFRQEGVVAIADGLVPGDRLVLDDIAPAIPGSTLLPVGEGR